MMMRVARTYGAFAVFVVGILCVAAAPSANAVDIDYSQVIRLRYEAADQRLGGIS